MVPRVPIWLKHDGDAHGLRGRLLSRLLRHGLWCTCLNRAFLVVPAAPCVSDYGSFCALAL